MEDTQNEFEGSATEIRTETKRIGADVRYQSDHDFILGSRHRQTVHQQQDKMNEILVDAVDWDMEFAPLDSIEQRAALRLAAYLSKEVDETAAAKLVFENTKYNLRRLLKANAYLPKDYRPGDDLLLPRA